MLKLYGIMPNDVYYMVFGVQLTRATKNKQRGVIPNYTMFYGEELLQKIGIIKAFSSRTSHREFGAKSWQEYVINIVYIKNTWKIETNQIFFATKNKKLGWMIHMLH